MNEYNGTQKSRKAEAEHSRTYDMIVSVTNCCGLANSLDPFYSLNISVMQLHSFSYPKSKFIVPSFSLKLAVWESITFCDLKASKGLVIFSLSSMGRVYTCVVLWSCAHCHGSLH